VATYEGRPGWQQTPDLGSFDFDERGEMLIPVRIGAARVTGSPALARASTKQIAAQPDTALAADTVVDEVAEIEAAAIDAMAADAAAIEAAAIAAMPPASAATGASARTTGPAAVEQAPARVVSKPDRHGRRSLAVKVTIAIAGLVTVSVATTLSLRSADPAVSVTPRAAFPTAEVDLDAAAAQPPPADSAVDERLIGPAAGHLDDPAPELPPDQPPVAGVTVTRASGPTTRSAIARPRVGPPPAGAPASKIQGPTATAHPQAGTSICPTWFKQPRGAEVTWNDMVAKLPVELPLPCNVEVTLVFRQPNHLGTTRKFTATVGGEPQIVRLRRAPVVPGSP
jgi:hypothetical protein